MYYVTKALEYIIRLIYNLSIQLNTLMTNTDQQYSNFRSYLSSFTLTQPDLLSKTTAIYTTLSADKKLICYLQLYLYDDC